MFDHDPKLKKMFDDLVDRFMAGEHVNLRELADATFDGDDRTLGDRAQHGYNLHKALMYEVERRQTRH